jgi:hypothetical protein
LKSGWALRDFLLDYKLISIHKRNDAEKQTRATTSLDFAFDRELPDATKEPLCNHWLMLSAA